MTLLPTARAAFRRAAARLALVSLLAVAFALPAAAQTRLQGRVVRGGQGVPGVAVQLHRVTQATRGQIDSTVTAADGRFSLPVPAIDPAAGFTVFFATAVTDGVRYFGPALHPDQPATGYEIAVYDTASAPALADSVRISRRDVFLIPDMDGSMQVAEIVRLRNVARRTVVADSKPVVWVPLPPGADQFEAGEGDRADSAAAPAGMVRMGDRAWLTDPLVPGDRDFFFRYRLPVGVKKLPMQLGRPSDTLYVYVRQPAPDVKARGLGEGAPDTAEGETFTRYLAAGLAPNADASLDWRGGTPSPVDPRWTALAIAGAILAGGVVVSARRGRAAG